MDFIKIILYLTCYSSVKAYNSEKAAIEDAKSGLNCENREGDDKFEDAYDEFKFFNKFEGTHASDTTAKHKVAVNCFGISGKLANLMEILLKNEANGTSALKVLFYSRSRSRPQRKLIQCGQSFSIVGTDFDIRKRTIFIVHGFFAGGDEQWIINMERALLTWGDVNIFVVDWSDGASTWNYMKAAVNTKTVGDEIATFIKQIIGDVIHDVEPSKWGPLHLIGHSLGAHICGYASYQLKLRGNEWPVYRITGLDPAQPCFRNSDQSLRLDKSDAHLVDIIHTNGRILRNLGLGLPYPLAAVYSCLKLKSTKYSTSTWVHYPHSMNLPANEFIKPRVKTFPDVNIHKTGHVDFYPNGGRIQPGCILPQTAVWNYLPEIVREIHKTACSHGRSQVYFTESIYAAVENNCTFWAHEWDMSFDGLANLLSSSECEMRNNYHKCIEMGINAEKYHRNGTFFAATATKSPFCNVRYDSVDDIMKNVERRITVLRDFY